MRNNEDMVDTLSLDEYLIENREASYIVKVKSDSMREAGIFTGDLLVVERGRSPRTGDIVVAEVHGEMVMRFFNPKEKKKTGEYKIIAVVRAVIRKFK